MPDGRGEHAAADVGDIGQLEQALNRAVFAVRAVQHGEDHVERRVRSAPPAPRRRRRRATRRSTRTSVSSPGRGGRKTSRPPRSARRVAAHLIDDFGRRRRRRRTIGEHPAAVLLDADRDRLVALAIEVARTRPPPTRARLRARRIARRRARRREDVSLLECRERIERSAGAARPERQSL